MKPLFLRGVRKGGIGWPAMIPSLCPSHPFPLCLGVGQDMLLSLLAFCHTQLKPHLQWGNLGSEDWPGWKWRVWDKIIRISSWKGETFKVCVTFFCGFGSPQSFRRWIIFLIQTFDIENTKYRSIHTTFCCTCYMDDLNSHHWSSEMGAKKTFLELGAKNIPSLKLTVRPLKMMVSNRNLLFQWPSGLFSGDMLVSGRVHLEIFRWKW